MTTLHFAQISDTHISALGDHHDLLSGRSAGFLANILSRLNQLQDLDFVLFSGDLFDQATWAEVDQFQEIIRTFKKPYYVIPGNHDRRPPHSTEGLTRRQFMKYFIPQAEGRSATPEAQMGYWSLEIKPNIQLIGLDSVKDDDWGGMIDAPQIEWLKSELDRHANKLIILAVHHPLHPLAPIDANPDWRNWLCSNGPEILDLLDIHPQVKIVLTGHHHLTRADWMGARLHLACPALALYPCAYRTLRLTQSANDIWQLAWQTHSATDEATIAKARTAMIDTWQKVGFDDDFVLEHVSLARGNQYDRNGIITL